MIKKLVSLIGKDRKLRTLFSGIIGSGFILISLIVAAGVFYL